MQRLISFGCSNTYGHGLPDCWNSKDNGPGPLPSKLAWPNLFADKIGRECINNGVCGASNLEILHNILNFQYRADDIVVVMWSEEDRDIIFTAPNEHIKLGHWMTHEYVKPYIELHNPYNSIMRSWMYVHHAHLFLKDKGLQFHFIDAYPDIQFHFKRPKYTVTSVKFTEITMQDFGSDYPRACDGVHLGELGHKELASRLYSEIYGEANES